tara:strand:+ start:2725 stop:4053 length:1329 start_codon:yes stop_codon:yes gene_type:complete
MNYRKLLLSKRKKIAVWGTGYIGLSTMVYFAKKNVKSVGFDVDYKKIKQINSGILPIPELKNWFGFDIKNFSKRKLIHATNDYKDILTDDYLVHFIAIPTEKDGKPYFKILYEVLKRISELKKLSLDRKPLIIIESTLTPQFTEKKIIPFLKKLKIEFGQDILYSVAPRRDWFVEGTKTLDVLDRVFGSSDSKSSIETRNVLSIVCRKLHQASSHKEAEMAKSVENAFRQMDITLANQLSLAYPNENIREVLKLVGTKWNVNTYFPGFGTGGYCIPLSSQYVLNQVKKKSSLTLLRETIKTDKFINLKIARSIASKKYRKVGVLGLSYKGNLKVNILSPVIPFVKELRRKKIKVEVYDPFYSRNEIKDILGTKSFKFPSDLNKFDCIIIATDHNEFKIEKKLLQRYLMTNTFILDFFGIWKKHNLNNNGKKYLISGNKNWLK